MIEIVGNALHQWDVGRYVQVTGIEVEYVHFANKGDSKAPIVGAVDGRAKIPPHLLQTGKQLCVYAVKDGITVESKIFYVKNREKPDDYVYEEEERDFIYALITNAETATKNAQQAAGDANTAAASANTASASANTATENANKAAVSANEAASSVDRAAKNANEAANKANQTAKSLMVIGSAEGDNIHLDDAIDQFLVGLRIFGKTTQAGTPTPDAPVDLVSVVNPTVTVNDQTLLIPYTLHGIPVTSGGNYTDANGQQWICDEVDMVSGKHVQCVGIKIFDGTEDWVISDYQSGGASTRFDYRDTKSPAQLLNNCVSAHFPHNGITKNGMWVNGDQYKYAEFRIMWDYSTVDELKAFLAEQHASGNSVTCLYALRSPIETPLSEEELAAFATLHTYRGNTTVFNDASAHMEIEYAMDAKKYIDRLVGASFISTATVE